MSGTRVEGRHLVISFSLSHHAQSIRIVTDRPLKCAWVGIGVGLQHCLCVPHVETCLSTIERLGAGGLVDEDEEDEDDDEEEEEEDEEEEDERGRASVRPVRFRPRTRAITRVCGCVWRLHVCADA
jgi:hypothetical protein